MQIYSLYWDNVDPELVTAQRNVFNHLGLPLEQHRINGMDHGEWIDWVMSRARSEVILFIDIDCVPYSRAIVERRFNQALNGVLVGAEGAANHIDPWRSYAGAWYVYISVPYWKAFARYSARAMACYDTCQAWTDCWKYYKGDVELIPPTESIYPRWNLPGRPQAYGIGTTYGDDCFHLFNARTGTDSHLFLSECAKIRQRPAQ
jgi:hypothetical protein